VTAATPTDIQNLTALNLGTGDVTFSLGTTPITTPIQIGHTGNGNITVEDTKNTKSVNTAGILVSGTKVTVSGLKFNITAVANLQATDGVGKAAVAVYNAGVSITDIAINNVDITVATSDSTNEELQGIYLGNDNTGGVTATVQDTNVVISGKSSVGATGIWINKYPNVTLTTVSVDNHLYTTDGSTTGYADVGIAGNGVTAVSDLHLSGITVTMSEHTTPASRRPWIDIGNSGTYSFVVSSSNATADDVSALATTYTTADGEALFNKLRDVTTSGDTHKPVFRVWNGAIGSGGRLIIQVNASNATHWDIVSNNVS
jgi:hypothetical protein